jgi:carbonic anhydrase/acetyltransferase-like protein (isoleucine patch superfamily)
LISGMVGEMDLITINDYCNIQSNAIIQPHTFEQRLLKLSPISIGKGCNINQSAIILPGAVLSNNVMIQSNTLIMKNDFLRNNSQWAGNPAKRILINNKNNLFNHNQSIFIDISNESAVFNKLNERRGSVRESSTVSVVNFIYSSHS